MRTHHLTCHSRVLYNILSTTIANSFRVSSPAYLLQLVNMNVTTGEQHHCLCVSLSIHLEQDAQVTVDDVCEVHEWQVHYSLWLSSLSDTSR